MHYCFSAASSVKRLPDPSTFPPVTCDPLWSAEMIRQRELIKAKKTAEQIGSCPVDSLTCEVLLVGPKCLKKKKRAFKFTESYRRANIGPTHLKIHILEKI